MTKPFNVVACGYQRFPPPLSANWNRPRGFTVVVFREPIINIFHFGKIKTDKTANGFVLQDFCGQQPKRGLQKPASISLGNFPPSQAALGVRHDLLDECGESLSRFFFDEWEKARINEVQLVAAFESSPHLCSINGVRRELVPMLIEKIEQLSQRQAAVKMESVSALKPKLIVVRRTDEYQGRS